jgi:hypothetical protein
MAVLQILVSTLLISLIAVSPKLIFAAAVLRTRKLKQLSFASLVLHLDKLCAELRGFGVLVTQVAHNPLSKFTVTH